MEIGAHEGKHDPASLFPSSHQPMDVPLDAQPPPAYGEPLTVDQFDAKTHQGLQLSAQTAQPSAQSTHDNELWETWDDSVYAANAAASSSSAGASSSSPVRRLNHASGSSPPLSTAVRSGANSPSLWASASPSLTPNSAPNSRPVHYSERRLPQVPQAGAQLSRNASTSKSRDRKPLGARSLQPSQQQYSPSQQRQQMVEAIARKEAERFLATAPIWNSEPVTGAVPVVSTTAPPAASASQLSNTTFITTPLEILPSPTSPTLIPPPMHSVLPPSAPAAVVSLPTVTEAPEADEERHAALFGENTAWRRNSYDDEAPPPFAPVAPPLNDAQLEETMAQLQRLQFSSSPTPSGAGVDTAGPAVVPAIGPHVPAPAETSRPDLQHASSAPTTTTSPQLPESSQYQSPSLSSPSPQSHFTSQNHRYSAPPAPGGMVLNVAPSPAPSPDPTLSRPATGSVPVSASASAPVNTTTTSSSSSRSRLSQPPMIRMRFDSAVAYDQGARGSLDGGGGVMPINANPSEFYSYVIFFP